MTGFGYKLQRLETLVDKQQVAIFFYPRLSTGPGQGDERLMASGNRVTKMRARRVCNLITGKARSYQNPCMGAASACFDEVFVGLPESAVDRAGRRPGVWCAGGEGVASGVRGGGGQRRAAGHAHPGHGLRAVCATEKIFAVRGATGEKKAGTGTCWVGVEGAYAPRPMGWPAGPWGWPGWWPMRSPWPLRWNLPGRWAVSSSKAFCWLGFRLL